MASLILIRHAEAEGFSSAGDLGRRLTSEGQKQAKRLGFALTRLNLRPEVAISSPAERARRTLEIALGQASISVPVEIERRIAPAHSLEDHLSALAERGEERVLICGHNPALTELASFLAGAGRFQFTVRVDRGALAVFELRGSFATIAEAGAMLRLLLQPRELERLI